MTCCTQVSTEQKPVGPKIFKTKTVRPEPPLIFRDFGYKFKCKVPSVIFHVHNIVVP